jgi:putative flippase GtrA
LAKVLSSLISVSVNYLLNSKFNFSNRQKIQAIFYLSYILMYAVLIIVNAVVNMLLIKLSGNIKFSFWVAAVMAAFLNYFSVKMYFKKINAKSSLS